MNRKGKNIFLQISQKTAHNLLTRFYESGIMLSFVPPPPPININNSGYPFTLNLYSTTKTRHIFTKLENCLLVVFMYIYFNLKACTNLFCTGFLCIKIVKNIVCNKGAVYVFSKR